MNEKDYKLLIGYAKSLLRGEDFCDPEDLVHDAIAEIGFDSNVGYIKSKIKRYFYKERTIYKSTVKTSWISTDLRELDACVNFKKKIGIASRTCSKCGESLPPDNFYTISILDCPGLTGFSPQCKRCRIKGVSEYMKSDSGKRTRNKYLKSEKGRNTTRKYSREYYHKMTDEQLERKRECDRKNSKTERAKELSRERQKRYREKKKLEKLKLL